MSYALGVDVGTTFTAAAVWQTGRAETVPLGGRANAIPSVVYRREDGDLLIGEAAERRAITDPLGIGREFKRRVGDSAPLLLHDQPFPAERLTAEVLRWVVDGVTQRQASPPAYTVLTCPVGWGEHRRSRLSAAACAVGMTDAGILAEPVAAGIYYAAQERFEPGALIAVYDLGGGTFDLALLRKTEGGFELVGEPAGDDRLGGIDFDQAVMDHVVATLGSAWTDLDADDPGIRQAMAQVRTAAVQAKEALSEDVEALIPVTLPGCSRQVRITRPELEDMVRGPLLETIGIFERTLATAGVVARQLDSVLLVGGSSRIPLVSRLIAGELGIPVAVDAHPKFAVCLGAAIAAAARLDGVATARRPTARPSGPESEPTGIRYDHDDSDRHPDATTAAAEASHLLVPASGRDTRSDVSIEADLARGSLTEPSDSRLPALAGPMRLASRVDRDEQLVVEIGAAGHGDGRRRVLTLTVVLVVAMIAVTALALLRPARRATDVGDDGRPSSTGGDTEDDLFAGTADVVGGPLDPAMGGGPMLGLTRLSSGQLIAVGSTTWPDGPDAAGGHPFAWRSDDDGTTWHPVWQGQLGDSGVTGAMLGVAEVTTPAGRGLVAVGYVDPPGGGADDRRGAVWLADPARPSDWTLNAIGELGGLTGSQELRDVAIGPSGELLAVGRDVLVDPDSGDAGLWRSTDRGLSWSRTDVAGLGGPGTQDAHRILRRSDGSFLLAGRRIDGASTGPVVWASVDAVSWTEPAGTPPTAAGRATLWGILELPGGLLVAPGVDSGLAGSAELSELGLWVRGPGATDPWLALALASGTGIAGAQEFRDIEPTNTGFVAIGLDNGRPATWRVIPHMG